MTKSPAQIILEIIVYLIWSGVETIFTLIKKLIELFISLSFIARISIEGLIIASLVGAITIFFMSKYLFGTTTSLVRILIIFLIFMLVILFIVLL